MSLSFWKPNKTKIPPGRRDFAIRIIFLAKEGVEVLVYLAVELLASKVAVVECNFFELSPIPFYLKNRIFYS
jgi:hypothetical protein